MAVQTALFETQTNGVNLTTGGADGITAVGGAFTGSTATPMHGTTHARMSNPGVSVITTRWAVTGSRYLELVFYLRVSTVPGVDFNVTRISPVADTPTSAQLYLLTTGGPGRIRMSTRAVVRYTTTGVLTAGSYYRIGLYLDAGTSTTDGAARVAYFLGDSGTAIEDSGLITGINVADAIGAVGMIRLGKDTANTFAGDVAYDSVRISTGADATQNFLPTVVTGAGVATGPTPTSTAAATVTALGAATVTGPRSTTTAAATVTAFGSATVTGPVPVVVAAGTVAAGSGTGQPKVWNGTAWVGKPAKVWNGTTWVTKPVKVWTGSTWKLAN